MPAHVHNNQESFGLVMAEEHRPGAKRCYSLEVKLKAIGEAKRYSKKKALEVY